MCSVILRSSGAVVGAFLPVCHHASIRFGEVRMQRMLTSLAGLLLMGMLKLSAQPTSVVNVLDQGHLESALNRGGMVTFGMDGTITLTNTLVISTNTTLDGTGHKIALDGGNAVRLLSVTDGVTLRLVNLSLVNGYSEGPRGQTNQPGGPGWGGAVYASGSSLELSGCTLTNNHSAGGKGGPLSGTAFLTPNDPSGGPAFGGAIYCTDGQLRASNCVFFGNSATGALGLPDLEGYTSHGGLAAGGAIYCTNCSLQLAGVTFTNNQTQGGDILGRAQYSGGAAFGGALADAAGSTRMSRCSFLSNQALGATRSDENLVDGVAGGSANGGAIAHQSGAMTIQDSLLESNTALGGGGTARGYDLALYGFGNGGAIYNQAGILSIERTALISNQAIGGSVPAGLGDFGHDAGGGAGTGGAILNLTQLTVTNCTLTKNAAIGGAGEVQLAGSGGSAFGGALFDGVAATGQFVNVTIAGNSVQAGVGSPMLPPPHWIFPGATLAIGSSIAVTNGTVSLVNTILSAEVNQTNVSGSIIDAGHNLSSDLSAGFTDPTSRGGIDPQLGPVADNGGPTPTMALLPASPAIDAGDDSVCPPTDQRGVTRPQGAACDIGAFELAPKLSLARGTNGVVTLDYSFEAAKTNSISASTNLTNWVPLGSAVSDSNGNLQFQDSHAASFPVRFYRIEPQP
jgi:hypothetical protein